jgi:hypothetical protein
MKIDEDDWQVKEKNREKAFLWVLSRSCGRYNWPRVRKRRHGIHTDNQVQVPEIDSKPKIPLFSAGLRDSDAERYSCAHVGSPFSKHGLFGGGMMAQLSGGNAPLPANRHPTGYFAPSNQLSKSGSPAGPDTIGQGRQERCADSEIARGRLHGIPPSPAPCESFLLTFGIPPIAQCFPFGGQSSSSNGGPA